MNYDVIIVGAGSAGCVLAARLSEDPHLSVLLLEAGPDYPDPAHLPPDIRSGYGPTYSHDWGYISEPGALPKPLKLPRAKLVGGCSATNATFAPRGTPDDYNEWSSRGNPGWSFREILPFFRRLENDRDFDNEWHGRGGPLPIRRYSFDELTPIQHAFLEACFACGYRREQDHNSPDALGVGPAPMNSISGVRQSTALTYLAQARGRPNLNIRSGALVDRILFEGRRAVGVRLVEPGETVFANRIVLAAGSYGSPAILMRSGIGPAEDLYTLGIPVVNDLPGVGKNLTDHPLMGLRFAAPASALRENVPTFQTILTLKSSNDVGQYDLQVIARSIRRSTPEEKSPTGAVFNLIVALLKPLSQGWLRLRSVDPSAPPIIDLGYLTHPYDLRRMLTVVSAARRIAQAPPLADFLIKELLPGSHVEDDSPDLKSVILANVGTYHHAVGTCRMGPASEKGSVVNHQGNVHGVKNLSIVDASIMPAIPAANTNIPTIMVAERCAAWLAETKGL